MVAPILPGLASLFRASVRHVSFIEPAYLLGYGIATLIYAPLSDKYGRFPVILFSMSCFIVLTACTGFCYSIDQMILLRLLTGIGAGGVAPTTIGWIGDRFPYEKRGHALGIFFGCMAGGMAFGSSAGALLTARLGWQMMFWTVAAVGVCILIILILYSKKLYHKNDSNYGSFRTMFTSFKEIYWQPRGRKTYLFVLFNGMFHSGVFSWTGYYFYKNYQLDEREIGFALLGYGIPGLLLGPLLGKLADKFGRNRIIPIGILTGALSAIFLGMNYSLAASCVFIATLSLGFDLTQPLYAAIITTVSPKKGAATGLFAFFLFMGYGFGSLLFSLIVNTGLNETFMLFGGAGVIAAGIAVKTFKGEK
ncbi:Predicted arabinose efflux permease, MFS family [Sediminibacterium ginsengisoli]|uniref:Predicted arabinose efflux permease, MFS family n=2 Tax=Sediminibacterium ginsengisoli TaxID=413434 RepID=A0A1T4K8D2_9BACT|nr:Predicted arabinose efflux permease, MFS family [Sediminibacterium ginsengisoli]